MVRKLAGLTTALALALGTVMVSAAPASAATPAVPCPTHTGVFSGGTLAAYQDVKQRGRRIDEYWLNGVAVTIFLIDGRYEAYLTSGGRVERLCYNTKPERPEGATERYRERSGSTGGGGGGALGAGAWGGPAKARWGIVTVGPVEDLR